MPSAFHAGAVDALKQNRHILTINCVTKKSVKSFTDDMGFTSREQNTNTKRELFCQLTKCSQPLAVLILKLKANSVHYLDTHRNAHITSSGKERYRRIRKLTHSFTQTFWPKPKRKFCNYTPVQCLYFVDNKPLKVPFLYTLHLFSDFWWLILMVLLQDLKGQLC